MSPEHDDGPRETPLRADGSVLAQHAVDTAALEAQARLAAIVTGSEDAIIAKTLRGIITAWNPAAERLFGYTAAEIVGRSILTIVPSELHDEEAMILARIARGERIRHFETVRVRKDGSRIPVALTISPVRGPSGRIIGASKILRDISERKALEAERARYLEQLEQQALELEVTNEQLQAQAIELELQNQELTSSADALEESYQIAESLRAEAEHANAAKSQFLATMSHELRTPINAIIGYAQLLELGVPDPVTPTQQQQLGRISASAEHLLGLINDVLDGAKLDFGEMHVAHEGATTNGAITAALMLVGPQADQHQIRLIDGRTNDTEVPYVGDDARVRQILSNLLSNAIKFTPAGGTITVTSGTASRIAEHAEHAAPGVRADGAGPWAYVRIADTGVGIPLQQQGAVFEPFVQVGHSQSPYTRSTGGTGLGLTISRRLARLMGGDLTVESNPGVGSTFTLWLPEDTSAHTSAGASPAGAVRPGPSRGRQTEIQTGIQTGIQAGAQGGLQPGPQIGPQAGLSGGTWHVRELGEVGRALREESDAILQAYTAALRADPAIPGARVISQAQLEDHVITLVTDLAQSLVIIVDAGDEAAALMRDSTAIQRTIVESHGARRFAQGWTEAELGREHQALREVILRVVRARLASRADDVSEALSVLMRITERMQLVGLAGYRQAAAQSASVGLASGRDRDAAPAG